jgi:hypothetical protein
LDYLYDAETNTGTCGCGKITTTSSDTLTIRASGVAGNSSEFPLLERTFVLTELSSFEWFNTFSTGIGTFGIGMGAFAGPPGTTCNLDFE